MACADRLRYCVVYFEVARPAACRRWITSSRSAAGAEQAARHACRLRKLRFVRVVEIEHRTQEGVY